MIIAETSKATGYEISIYNAYPFYFWLLLISSISIGIIIMVRESFSNKNSKSWILGYSTILFTNFVILMLPFFRGYATFGRGDVLTHIGYINEIISSGHINLLGTSHDDFYPAIHILFTNLYYLTGISPETLAMTIPIFFILFYMVTIYVLGKVITKNSKMSILIAAFGSLLLFRNENLMLAPSVLSFNLLPIILFIYYKTRSSINNYKYSILFIIFIILMPFLHPGDGVIFLLVFILGLEVSNIFYRIIIDQKSGSIKDLILNEISWNSILILLVAWFTWFASFTVFENQLSSIINFLLYDVGAPTSVQYAELISRAHLSIYQLIELFIKSYGQYAIYSAISLSICIYVLKKLVFSKSKVNEEEFKFSLLFIFISILTFISFFGVFGLAYSRVLRYILFVTTILNGISMYLIFNRPNYKKLGIIFVTCILIFSGAISVFNAFDSPIIKTVNAQVTQMEIIGTNWYFDYRDPQMEVQTIDASSLLRLFNVVKGNQLNGNDSVGLSLCIRSF